MEKKTMVCYGDSNTYGYDPRAVLGGRYDAAHRWCDLLAEKTGWEIINCGENGRTIPSQDWTCWDLKRAMEDHAPVDYAAVMLGSNDVLMGFQLPVTAITTRMENLLQMMRKAWPDTKLLLLAPPQMELPETELNEKIIGLGEAYHAMADRLGIPYIDTQSWFVELSFDGVHFSETGHHTFAEEFFRFLQTLN